MHGLETIVKMNRRVVAVEDNHNRHCSYSGDSATGIVLHSARMRNTSFLAGNIRNPGGSPAGKFLARWLASNSAEEHDRLVERYFV